MGPRRPRSIKTAKINFPGIVSDAVIPVDRPTVPSAEIHSKEASRNQRGRSAAFPPLSTPRSATSATNAIATKTHAVAVARSTARSGMVRFAKLARSCPRKLAPARVSSVMKVLTLNPPPVEPGPAPIAMRSIVRKSVALARLPYSTVLKPAVRHVVV